MLNDAHSNINTIIDSQISKYYPLDQLGGLEKKEPEFRDLSEQERKSEEFDELLFDLVLGIAGPVLYKGITNWVPGSMVKGGKFVGGGKYKTPPFNIQSATKLKELPKETMWTTTSKDVAKGYSRRQNWTPDKRIVPKGEVLKFDVPHSYIDKLIAKEKAFKLKGYEEDLMYLFKEGIPKEFFKKRIK